MNVTKNLSITNKSELESTLVISGDIGYNFWADTYEDYKKNTSEAMALELQSIKDLKATVINLEIESLGGDVFHGLAIYSMLKQSGAKVNTFYRGANASMSTVIGSVSNVEDISMDETGLYLIHKPMSYSGGNANDMQNDMNALNKVQKSLETAYLNLGVSQESLDDLMERNGGHGEWLTFAEAKEYGFVSKTWETKKVSNYAKQDFSNRKILIPNNLINHNKTKTMQIDKETEDGLFTRIWDKFKNESKAEAEASELEDLKAENKSLKEQLEEKEVEVVEEITTEEVAEVTEEEVVVEEVVVEEMTTEQIVNKAVKEALKSNVKPMSETSNSAKDKDVPTWKRHLNTHNKINQ